jgi:outer membrane protein assembly factor BamB
VLWQRPLGTGFAGPAVVGDRVIIFHREKDEAVVECLARATGEPQWRYTYTTEYVDRFGFVNGPRATPTVADGCVYTHGADGKVHALDLATGKLRWTVDTATAQGSPQGFFGRACAPLVVGGKVIITTGGPKAVVAFDAQQGSVAWASGEDEASYASPLLASPDTLLCWLRNNLTTFAVKDGRQLAAEHFRPDMEASVSAATPVKTDRGWFISAGYDVGASLWDVSAEGTLKKTWSGSDLMDCHYATPVYRDSHIYGFHGRQEGGMTLRCLDLASGKVAWESGRVKGGTLMLVQDKLLVTTEDGELWIVKATPAKYEQLAAVQILRAGHRSYPAYSDGVLYARDAEKLVALRLAK